MNKKPLRASAGYGERQYARENSCVFRKTRDLYGGLSNMASGYPLMLNGHSIRSSEALYQACRYPDRPDVQQVILAEASPMSAKLRSKAAYNITRADWESVRIKVMRWCIHVKLAQHFLKFGMLLESTGVLDIVEESRRDRFWGAVSEGPNYLVGTNALGRLLMQLRSVYNSARRFHLLRVPPPHIPNFLMLGEPIQEVDGRIQMLRMVFGINESHPEAEALLRDSFQEFFRKGDALVSRYSHTTPSDDGEDLPPNVDGENLWLFSIDQS